MLSKIIIVYMMEVAKIYDVSLAEYLFNFGLKQII